VYSCNILQGNGTKKISLSKDKIVPVHAVEIQLHLFLTLALHKGERSSTVPAALLLGKALWYPLNRRLSRPQSQSGHSGEENIFFPCWEYKHDFSAVQPATEALNP